jgi:SAM-dependent methyltransferase
MLKTEGLLTRSRRCFRSIFYSRLRYYLRSIVYANPFLTRLVNYMRNHKTDKKNHDPAFWDNELKGAKAWYLGGTLPIDIRRSIMATLIQSCIPNTQSILDVGCGAGGLRQTMSLDNFKQYVGVDISEYAIKKAKEQILNSKKTPLARFYNCDLCDFTPEKNTWFDAIVFSEVLYYLNVKEAVAQLERYSKWLRPGGIFCISMKDDPKSQAIYRNILKKFKHINSILLQHFPAHCRFKFQIVKNQECLTFMISVFTPPAEGKCEALEHSAA